MLPKQQFYVIEAPTVDELNTKLRDMCGVRGCVPYSELKVIFYGHKRHNEKIYIQVLVYNRTWLDFLLRRN